MSELRPVKDVDLRCFLMPNEISFEKLCWNGL